MTPVDEDEFTELRDASIPRVDLVDKAANGTTFLIAKNAEGAPAGLLDPSFVRDLIGKAAPTETPGETVTMTGSPGAIAHLIHAAAVRQVEKTAHTPDPDSNTPDNPTQDGRPAGDVAKEVLMDDDALDPTTALAEPDGDAPGMPTDPGSPAWEAVDAATARKWTSILARAQNALDMLAERELLEAASADPDDVENAFDLQDACCAIDYAISLLAPYAVSEQAEADCVDDMAMVGKALATVDTGALDTIESLAPVAKSGRVLSSANEQAIRGAVESLQKVLASLPAPVTEDSGRPVAKTANQEADMPKATPAADTTAASGQEPAMGTHEPEPKPVAGQAVTDMAKADGEKPPVVVVYDQKGRLIGIADPADITPVANAEADADDMDDAATPAADDTAADGDVSETPDLTPAPSGEAGTPADAVPDDDAAVTKSSNETNPDSDMVQSSITDMVKGLLDEHSATQEQVIAKQADTIAHLAGIVETLKGQVQVLEEQPAAPRVFSNGAVPPPPHMLRGQDQGVMPTAVDVAKAREMKASLYGDATAGDQNQVAHQLQEMAIAALREIQRP